MKNLLLVLLLFSCHTNKNEVVAESDFVNFKIYKTFEMETNHAYIPYTFQTEDKSRFGFLPEDVKYLSKKVEVDNYINISDSFVVIGDANNKALKSYRVIESFIEKDAGVTDTCYRMREINTNIECLFCHSIDWQNKTFYTFRYQNNGDCYKGIKLD